MERHISMKRSAAAVCQGEALDFQIIYPIAQEEAKGCLENLQIGICESLYSGTDVANTSGSGRW